jgi:outer membrane lipoprotein carrier protein
MIKAIPVSILIWTVSVLCVGQPASSQQPKVDLVLERLQGNYQQIRSFSADFVQYFKGHNIDLEESGILIMKKPGRMYWEYQKPKKKLFIADGKMAYFYVPDERQVIQSELKLDRTKTPLLFLFGKGDISEDFAVAYERAEQALESGNLLLRLVPRRPQSEFSHVLLEVDPGQFLIHRLSVVELIGQRNDYVFSNFKANVKVPDRRFKFKAPKGTEVIRQ